MRKNELKALLREILDDEICGAATLSNFFFLLLPLFCRSFWRNSSCSANSPFGFDRNGPVRITQAYVKHHVLTALKVSNVPSERSVPCIF